MKIAAVFSGQGAQKAGMGKSFYENSKAAKDILDSIPSRMLEYCFEGSDEELSRTEITQPCLYAVSCAGAAALNEAFVENGLEISMAAGFSLGEYSALVACGAMNYGDAVRVVRKRGIYMENAVPAGRGGMSAIIGMDAETVEKICADVAAKTGLCVVPANYNCPGQIVISGHKQAVDYAGERFKEAGAKLVAPLNVSGPFHSPMLAVAGEKLAAELENVTFRDPIKPYVANVTALPVTTADGIKESLTRQVSSPVRWEQSVRAMLDLGVTDFVEIGPGKTLAGFMKRIDRAIPVVTVSTVADLDKLHINGEINNVGNEKYTNA